MQSSNLPLKIAIFFVVAFPLIGCNRTPQVAKQEGPPVLPVPYVPKLEEGQPVSGDFRIWTIKTEEVEAVFRGTSTTRTSNSETTTVTLQRKAAAKRSKC